LPATALVLALVGISGVMSYLVSRSARDLGIRIALGATHRMILTWVLRHALIVTVTGIDHRSRVAVLLARVMRGLVFGVEPTDAATFAAGDGRPSGRGLVGQLYPGAARDTHRSADVPARRLKYALETPVIDNDRPEVTIIIATYARPDALVCAVRSIQLQTFARWRALVIGDCLRRGDLRRHADLSRRSAHCLRQPAVAMWGGRRCPTRRALRSPTPSNVAFLNHDDVWMPEHLALALDRLRAASRRLLPRARGDCHQPSDRLRRREPVFTMVSPVDRTLREAFWRHNMYVEPASAWVVHRQFADRVGPWRPMTELFRIVAGRLGASRVAGRRPRWSRMNA
jgi:hypothetical protein